MSDNPMWGSFSSALLKFQARTHNLCERSREKCPSNIPISEASQRDNCNHAFISSHLREKNTHSYKWCGDRGSVWETCKVLPLSKQSALSKPLRESKARWKASPNLDWRRRAFGSVPGVACVRGLPSSVCTKPLLTPSRCCSQNWPTFSVFEDSRIRVSTIFWAWVLRIYSNKFEESFWVILKILCLSKSHIIRMLAYTIQTLTVRWPKINTWSNVYVIYIFLLNMYPFSEIFGNSSMSAAMTGVPTL